MWHTTQTDSTNWWEQTVVLVGEQGEELMRSTPQRFQMSHRVMRALSPFSSIPVYKESQCFLKLFLRNLGMIPDATTANVDWAEIMQYPISLHHTFYPS